MEGSRSRASGTAAYTGLPRSTPQVRAVVAKPLDLNHLLALFARELGAEPSAGAPRN